MSFIFQPHFTSLIVPAAHLQPIERSELIEDAAWQRRQVVGIQVPVSPNTRLSFIFPTPFRHSRLSSGALTDHRGKQGDRRCRLAVTSTRWNSGTCQPKYTLEFYLSNLLRLSHLSSGTLTANGAKQADRRCHLAATSTRWNPGTCQPKCTLELHLSNPTSPLPSFQRRTYNQLSEAS